MSLKEDVLALIQDTQTAMQLADGALEKQAAVAAQVEQLIPELSQIMVDGEWIPVHEKEAALVALRDPVKTLGLLKYALTQSSPKTVPAMGKPINGSTKAASAQPAAPRRNPGFIGQRTGEPTDADRAFFSRLGLPEPTTGY